MKGRMAPQAENGPPSDVRTETSSPPRMVPDARQARSSSSREGRAADCGAPPGRRLCVLGFGGRGPGFDQIDDALNATRVPLEEHPQTTKGNARMRARGTRTNDMGWDFTETALTGSYLPNPRNRYVFNFQALCGPQADYFGTWPLSSTAAGIPDAQRPDSPYRRRRFARRSIQLLKPSIDLSTTGSLNQRFVRTRLRNHAKSQVVRLFCVLPCVPWAECLANWSKCCV